MKDENASLHPSAFILLARRRSQVVRQRSAKPLFVGSIPTAAFIRINNLGAAHKLPLVICMRIVCELFEFLALGSQGDF